MNNKIIKRIIEFICRLCLRVLVVFSAMLAVANWNNSFIVSCIYIIIACLCMDLYAWFYNNYSKYYNRLVDKKD